MAFRRASLLLWPLAAILAGDAMAQGALDTLRPAHPRLLALDPDITRVRNLIVSNPAARQVHARLVAEAQKILAAPPVEYKLIGPRLLDKSRTALGRIYTLAFLYRLNGEKQYRDRALLEMKAIAAFPDWNPSHFLDTAEMTHAFAIGYDWLYPSLTPDERAWIRAAIVTKGLEPALGVYANRGWWPSATHNWNQVCNGGITLGALAVAEDEPSRSDQILREAVRSIPLAMESYAPDGGWIEGPGYWDYATRYNVYFLAGLETALGQDFGLSRLKGFDQAGEFRIYFSGPSAKTFNYADASDSLTTCPAMFWLARRFSQPVYAGQELALLASSTRAHALDLVWWPESNTTPQQANWPLDKIFERVQTAFLRGSWTSPDTIWIAAKGGDNKANHAHLDLGSFVLDSHGVRWALDLGGDDYNLPAYFGGKRWTYYRLRTESHNTVLIDGANQDPAAEARILRRDLTPEHASVTFDLAAAYPGKLARHERTVAMPTRTSVRIVDEIDAPQPVDALWGMVTGAEVALHGNRAVLTQAGKAMTLNLLSPADAEFAVVSTQPAAPQRPNEGTRKLVVRLPGKVTHVKIAVEFTFR